MAWSRRKCACRARMQAHVGRATARVVEMAHAPGRWPSPAFRVKVRPTALAKARRHVSHASHVKAAVARRGRLNNPDKLKSAVAAMTRHHWQCQQQLPRQGPRTTFSRM